MDFQSMVPLVIYDDQCYLCVKFAKVVNFLARGRLRLIGHYTELGKKLRESILDSSALEMFWFVDNEIAYGGRSALIPLIKGIRRANNITDSISVQESCDIGCKNPKAVFIRSFSLITNSKKIKLT
jgi:predicted DCC family thiol-disulfide oxidoreductase YuxK